MNYIRHLTTFFEKISRDEQLNPTHISLYISLFQYWNVNRFKNPISITRSEIMRISKIYAKATYHKCIKDLHELGYIVYEPSYNHFKGSLVHLLDFELVQQDVQEMNGKDTKKQTTTVQLVNRNRPVNEQVLNRIRPLNEQELVPSINNTNSINNINCVYGGEQSQKINELKNFNTKQREEKEKLRQKKKKVLPEKSFSIPSVEEVRAYFDLEQYPTLEAEKFHNYFSSNGWLVGGKTKMKDWKAAARNWILNTKNFGYDKNNATNGNRAGGLHSEPNKNYSEPL